MILRCSINFHHSCWHNTCVHVVLEWELCVCGGFVVGVCLVIGEGEGYGAEVDVEDVLVSPLMTVVQGVPGLQHLDDVVEVSLARS